jgi:hypothetical protein
MVGPWVEGVVQTGAMRFGRIGPRTRLPGSLFNRAHCPLVSIKYPLETLLGSLVTPVSIWMMQHRLSAKGAPNFLWRCFWSHPEKTVPICFRLQNSRHCLSFICLLDY